MSIAYLYSASSDSTNDERVMTWQDRSQLDHIILEVIERGYHRAYELFRPAKVVVNDLSTPDLTDEPETLRL